MVEQSHFLEKYPSVTFPYGLPRINDCLVRLDIDQREFAEDGAVTKTFQAWGETAETQYQNSRIRTLKAYDDPVAFWSTDIHTGISFVLIVGHNAENTLEHFTTTMENIETHARQRNMPKLIVFDSSSLSTAA